MKIDDYIDVIANMNLFCNFSYEELSRIFKPSKFEIKEYKKEEIIHLQNELCHTMDIIISGKVIVQKIEENGNVLTINDFSVGDSLGANIIFSSKNYYPMTIAAISKVVILHLKKELILELCQNSIDFMTLLLQEISDRTLFLTDKIATISLKTIRQRIDEFLKYEYYIQKSNVIKLNISKKDLAERIGIQRTSLSRELNKMRKEGLIEYDSRTITIKKDMEDINRFNMK